MISGPRIEEFVFRGASVKLGDDIVGQFSLTLWYLGDPGKVPDVAEISFRTECIRGEIPRRSSRRSFDLFRAMQLDVADWIDAKSISKTALVTPTDERPAITRQAIA